MSVTATSALVTITFRAAEKTNDWMAMRLTIADSSRFNTMIMNGKTAMPTYRTLILLSALVSSSLLLEAAGAQESSFVQHENIVYGEADGVGLLMDVFTPIGKSNGLGVVDVISGAWYSDRNKIRDHARAQTFQILCGKGYTVFAVRPGSVTKFSARKCSPISTKESVG